MLIIGFLSTLGISPFMNNVSALDKTNLSEELNMRFYLFDSHYNKYPTYLRKYIKYKTNMCFEEIYQSFFFSDNKSKYYKASACREKINKGYKTNLVHYFYNSECPDKSYLEVQQGMMIIGKDSIGNKNVKLRACVGASKKAFDKNLTNLKRIRFYSNCPSNSKVIVAVQDRLKNKNLYGCSQHTS